MTKRLRIGYMPLTDAALIHVAQARGFAAARGLELELVRETSWANIRDRLILGYFDAAHMLAPAAIASSLGLGHLQVPLVAPVTLGLNGNAVTLSRPLFEAIEREAGDAIADPRLTARALAGIVRRRRRRGDAPLTFAHVFPFSSHHYQLRLWMRAGGIGPDEDVRLVVLPPPFMVESLRTGHVDGFCVGAPWNSLAAAAEVGIIIHPGTAIVSHCPEKVLAMRAPWAKANPEEARALAGAIGDASAWASDPANGEELFGLLARRSEPGVTKAMIAACLGAAVSARAETGLRLDPAAIRAEPAQALWLFAQMVASGQVLYSPRLAAAAAAVYAPELGPAMAGAAEAPAAFEGPSFEPNDISSYVASLRKGAPSGA